MKISLPDVNLLVALLAETHPFQSKSLAWWEGRENHSVAICRVTQMGMLRVLTNAKALPAGACTIPRAWDLVDELLSDQRAFFKHETADVESIWKQMTRAAGVGPSAWTDAYLAAFAHGHGYEFVTFDRGFRRWDELALQVLE